MRESEIIAEAERLFAGSQAAGDDGYVTLGDMLRAGYGDYAAHQALDALFDAGMLETKRVRRMTRAGHPQNYPGYKLKITPQNA
jgi:hypothetical protein